MKICMPVFACLTAFSISSASYAATLNSGSITNEKSANAEVEFNQSIELINDIMPPAARTAGNLPGESELATGNVRVADNTKKVRIAIRAVDQENIGAYAKGHDKDPDYFLNYNVIPSDEGAAFTLMKQDDESYYVSDDEVNSAKYIIESDEGTQDIKAGVYTLVSTVGVYNP